ncbi:MAG: helix-turn-helix transcriptional regulator [Planctomycetes bacterium]|nr:helix-turn-helix transcriptional regulator [Planctomycetota bacterium]
MLVAALRMAGGVVGLARAIGASRDAVRRWRSGERRPGPKVMTRLAAVAAGEEPAEREQRIREYERRAAAGVDLFPRARADAAAPQPKL